MGSPDPGLRLILAFDDRRRVLAPEYREAVIRANGDVYRTFLVDGMVAGTWSYRDGKVQLNNFAPLPRRVRREVDDEARRVAAFHT
jgi:hypothetical protein